MIIEHGDVRYALSTEEAIALEREGRHPSRRLVNVRACQRCAAICVQGVTTCNCCEKYRITGDYPSDGRRHVDVMSIDEFAVLAERAGLAA